MGDYDADYKIRIATHNRILVLESPPEEILFMHDHEAILPCFPAISRGIIWIKYDYSALHLGLNTRFFFCAGHVGVFPGHL